LGYTQVETHLDSILLMFYAKILKRAIQTSVTTKVLALTTVRFWYEKWKREKLCGWLVSAIYALKFHNICNKLEPYLVVLQHASLIPNYSAQSTH